MLRHRSLLSLSAIFVILIGAFILSGNTVTAEITTPTIDFYGSLPPNAYGLNDLWELEELLPQRFIDGDTVSIHYGSVNELNEYSFTPKYTLITFDDASMSLLPATTSWSTYPFFPSHEGIYATEFLNGYKDLESCMWLFGDPVQQKTVHAYLAQRPEMLTPNDITHLPLPTNVRSYLGLFTFPDPTQLPPELDIDNLYITLRCYVFTSPSIPANFYSTFKLNVQVGSDITTNQIQTFSDLTPHYGLYRYNPPSQPVIKVIEAVEPELSPVEFSTNDFALREFRATIHFDLMTQGDHFVYEIQPFPLGARLVGHNGCTYDSNGDDSFAFVNNVADIEFGSGNDYNGVTGKSLSFRIFPNYWTPEQDQPTQQTFVTNCRALVLIPINTQMTNLRRVLESPVKITSILRVDGRRYCDSTLTYCTVIAHNLGLSYTYAIPPMTPTFITPDVFNPLTITIQIPSEYILEFFSNIREPGIYPTNAEYLVYSNIDFDQAYNWSPPGGTDILIGQVFITDWAADIIVEVTQQRLPLSLPYDFQFIPVDPLQRTKIGHTFRVPSFMAGLGNNIFVPKCIEAIYSQGVFSYNNKCGNGGECDVNYGVCNCNTDHDIDEMKLSMYKAKADDMCDNTCTDILNCSIDVNASRNPTTRHCECDCYNDSTYYDCSDFNNGVEQSLRQQFPTVAIRGGLADQSIDPYFNPRIPQPIDYVPLSSQIGNYVSDRIVYSFGSVETFFAAAYNGVEYFTLGMNGTSLFNYPFPSNVQFQVNNQNGTKVNLQDDLFETTSTLHNKSQQQRHKSSKSTRPTKSTSSSTKSTSSPLPNQQQFQTLDFPENTLSLPCEWKLWSTPQGSNGGLHTLLRSIFASGGIDVALDKTEYADGGWDQLPQAEVIGNNFPQDAEVISIVQNPFFNTPYIDALSQLTRDATLELHCLPGLKQNNELSNLQSSIVPISPFFASTQLNTPILQTSHVTTELPKVTDFTSIGMDFVGNFGMMVKFSFRVLRKIGRDNFGISDYIYGNGPEKFELRSVTCTIQYASGQVVTVEHDSYIPWPLHKPEYSLSSKVSCNAIYTIENVEQLATLSETWKSTYFSNPDETAPFELHLSPIFGSPFYLDNSHNTIGFPRINIGLIDTPTPTFIGPGSTMTLVFSPESPVYNRIYRISSIIMIHNDITYQLQIIDVGDIQSLVIRVRIPPTVELPDSTEPFIITAEVHVYDNYDDSERTTTAYTLYPELGDANIELKASLACSIECFHGGIVNSQDCTCTCPAIWNGDEFCTTCSENRPQCLHGGVYNEDVCKCDCSATDGYTGDDCGTAPVIICELCQNGGIANDDCTSCDCSDTPFVGPTCTECTLCKNNGIANQQCTTCSCADELNWIGQTCETCQLTCFNSGTRNIGCSQCNCPRVGYSGKHCECHIITFTITLQSVPKAILEQFQSNPDWVTSSDAMSYLRNSLYEQSILTNPSFTREMFSTVQITSLKLGTDITTPSLALSGRISDNCALDDTNNYEHLESNWIQFLTLILKNDGAKVDDEIIPVIDVTYDVPDLKCDQVYDKSCGQVVNQKPQDKLLPTTNNAITIFSSLVMIICIFLAVTFY